MRYRLTCLTPVLVGDGSRLSPVDYMVWKDHVNVLNQRRIFRLLAKGPRLENYLMQIKRAEKLDFASWGGFAQNFAGRRIPFEHPSSTGYWERLRAEHLHIPTFASGPAGPYLPGSALKGALRTALVASRIKPEALDRAAAQAGEGRPWRRPAESLERDALGSSGRDRMRMFGVADSSCVETASMKVYLLRTATLVARDGGKFGLGWKQSPRGHAEARRPEDGTPEFAEMAAPDTCFEGNWREAGFSNDSETTAALGWGSGLVSKTLAPDTTQESYRQMLRTTGIYDRAIRSGMPFPKTRRIVFLGNQPAAVAGWALLEVG